MPLSHLLSLSPSTDTSVQKKALKDAFSPEYVTASSSPLSPSLENQLINHPHSVPTRLSERRILRALDFFTACCPGSDFHDQGRPEGILWNAPHPYTHTETHTCLCLYMYKLVCIQAQTLTLIPRVVSASDIGTGEICNELRVRRGVWVLVPLFSTSLILFDGSFFALWGLPTNHLANLLWRSSATVKVEGLITCKVLHTCKWCFYLVNFSSFFLGHLFQLLHNKHFHLSINVLINAFWKRLF